MSLGQLQWFKTIRAQLILGFRFKTIRAQLMLGFGVILLLHGVSAAIGYGSLQRLRHRSQTTLDNAAQVRELSLELKANFLLARQAEEAYFNTWQGGGDSAKAQANMQTNQDYLAKARENLSALWELEAKNPALAEEIALLDSLFRNYASAFAVTTNRLAENSLNYEIHQQLMDVLAALPSEDQKPDIRIIRRLVWQLMAHQQTYLNTQDPAYLDELQSGLGQLSQNLNQLPAGTLDPAAQELMQTYMTSLSALLFLNQQVQVNRIIAANVNRDINIIIQTIGDRSAARSAQARLELAKTANQSSAALLATALTALALAIWASLLLGRRIITPLTLMAAAAERIAHQDLSQSLELRGDNEFSAVAEAFNHMVKQLRYTLETLEQRVDERTEALANTNQALQEQTHSLAGALQQLRHSETNYRLLIDHLHAGVVVHAADTTILMCNQMAAQLLGLPTEAVVSQQANQPTWHLVDEAGTALTPDHYPVNQVIASQRPLQNYVLGISSQTKPCTWVLVNAFPTFDEAHRLTQVVVTFIDISDRKLAEEELRHQALHDALTGLPNRTLFTERLDQAVQRAQRYPEQLFAVLFIDLDRFKVINDSLGHLVGDQLLIQIADILRRHIRASDTVARLGGDEFVILLEHITDVNEAIQVVERIQRDINAPFTLMGHTVFTSASLGIALASPDYTRGEDMLRDADNAMYRAKAQGQSSSYVIFSPAMHETAIQLFELETHLRQALERQDFILHYQPIVSLDTEHLLGFEALVRWVHPQRGLIAPNEFIPLAEETGLIAPLSEWIFEEACRQMADWCARLPAANALKIGVNVAAAHFDQPKFFEQINTVLKRTSLPATNLNLEVTESLLLTNVEGVIATLSHLQRQGIEISIDDFGTGYSSLSYLKRFPINTLKIDRSFVENIDVNHDDVSIVKAIIQIAKSLDMTVVAEGVETEFQTTRLQQLGCDAMQGYWVATPLPANQAEAFIQRRSPCPQTAL